MEPSALDWNTILPEPPQGPAIYWRHKWPDYSINPGLPFSRGTMQNLDSLGTGPVAMVLAGKVAYTRASLVAWLNRIDVKSRPQRTGQAA